VPAVPESPPLTLHGVPLSHPALAAERGLQVKGLEFERVDLQTGEHGDAIEAIYGEGHRTVPGLLVGDEPVHGSRAILARIEELVPEPPLFPEPIAERVREEERWGDEAFQSMGRILIWGALHFRPEAMGTYAGGEPLDPPGTDFAIKYLRAAWRYTNTSAARVAEDLAAMPGALDRIDAAAEEGVLGGDQPTAADLQIGATARMMLTIGDLRRLLAGRTAERIARRWFPDFPGHVPTGAYPDGWVPAEIS
jgi:glutathione S-transferase